MEEMKAMVRTLAEQQKALLDQQAKQQQPQQPKTDTQVQTASNSSSTTTTSNGPVRNIKYQIPAQWAGTAPGYVINYAGYNYIVNNDNTMTYYEGQVYYPNQNTNSVQTTPTTYYTNYPNTVVTPNTYWNGVTWVSNGYGWNGGGYWNNRARIEEARAQQQQYMFDRAVANDITSIINSAINRGR
jgi:hypothetical protein